MELGFGATRELQGKGMSLKTKMESATRSALVLDFHQSDKAFSHCTSLVVQIEEKEHKKKRERI